ncbi:uncharacterized protein isoform X3 [Rhodnius prolixus]|uniref:uncharacterized protein isoform X3 n=1 Tax=Rhodnius prolixus TaxID=13249 RepID=UPI003D18EF4C
MSEGNIQSVIDKPGDQDQDEVYDDWAEGKLFSEKPLTLHKKESWRMKKSHSKTQSQLSFQQLRRKCRTTVYNLERKCSNLKSKLEITEANVVDEKIKLYRLQKIAELANEMTISRENKLAETIEQLRNEIHRLDNETQNAAGNAQWLAHENHLLKWFLELLNNVGIAWICSRLCCSSSIGV